MEKRNLFGKLINFKERQRESSRAKQGKRSVQRIKKGSPCQDKGTW